MPVTPVVSVIIPTYRHQDLVVKTLNSVFAQSFTDYEVIVVNDGSPDNTAEVLKPLAEAGKIRYIEQENQGQSAARNRGIAEARGEFIALLDDDDLWPAHKLRSQIEALRAAPDAVMVYSPEIRFSNEETVKALSDFGTVPELPSGNAYAKFLERNWIVSPGQTLVRTDALKTIGGFDPTIWGCDDWDIFIRLAAVGEFVFLPGKVALYYREHLNNASKNAWRMFINAKRVYHKHFDTIPRGQYENERIVSLGWVHGHFAWVASVEAGRYWRERNYGRFLWQWAIAFRLRPKLIADCFLFNHLRRLKRSVLKQKTAETL